MFIYHKEICVPKFIDICKIILTMLLLLYIYYFKQYIHKFINNYKVCLCTAGKLENKYAIEFVEYYKKYGVDKIFIYDNNDINNEHFDTVLSKYISNKYVEIINYRGRTQIQRKFLKDCYKNNYKNFNWFLMFDMDEFIYLKNVRNIKFYLNKKQFNDCKIIRLNRAFHTDNDQIYYINKSLIERFPKAIYNNTNVKSILRGNITNMKITSVHKMSFKYKACNGFGKKDFKNPDFKFYYIKHYFFKSTEEFIDKLNKGDVLYINNNHVKLNKIKYYFKFNKITTKKINYIQKQTGIDLKNYRNKNN